MRFCLSVTMALVLLIGTTSAADPITVTAGRINLTDEPGSFDVRGSGFDVSVGWFPSGGWGGECSFGCSPGTKVDLARSYTFSDAFQGHGGIINGVAYPSLYTVGELTFDAPVFNAPFDNEHDPLPMPFTFHGNVAIFANKALMGPALFENELVGTGKARVGGIVSSSRYYLEDVVYAFASPVPEPSTLMMVVSGLVATTSLRRQLFRRGARDQGKG
jgi:hypothetical protein